MRILRSSLTLQHFIATEALVQKDEHTHGCVYTQNYRTGDWQLLLIIPACPKFMSALIVHDNLVSCQNKSQLSQATWKSHESGLRLK